MHSPHHSNIVSQIEKQYEKAMSMKFLHDYSENVCIFRSKIIVYPTRLINTVTASISAINMNDGHFVSPVTMGVLSIVTACCNMTESYLNLQRKSEQHKIFSNKINQVLNEVETYMSLPEIERKDDYNFMKTIALKITHLANGGSPNYVYGAQKALEKELEKDNIENPFKLRSLNITPLPTPRPMTKQVDDVILQL